MGDLSGVSLAFCTVVEARVARLVALARIFSHQRFVCDTAAASPSSFFKSARAAAYRSARGGSIPACCTRKAGIGRTDGYLKLDGYGPRVGSACICGPDVREGPS